MALPNGTTVLANLGDLGKGDGDVIVVGFLQPNKAADNFGLELNEGKRAVSYFNPDGGVHTALMSRRDPKDYGPEGGGLTFIEAEA